MQNQDRVARRCDHGLPMRGNSHLIICRYGSPLDGIRSIAFLAKGLACSSVCRLSFGSNIHSRMILLVFRLHVKILCPNGRRGQHKGRAVMRKDRCREVNAPAIGQVLADAIRKWCFPVCQVSRSQG